MPILQSRVSHWYTISEYNYLVKVQQTWPVLNLYTKQFILRSAPVVFGGHVLQNLKWGECCLKWGLSVSVALMPHWSQQIGITIYVHIICILCSYNNWFHMLTYTVQAVSMTISSLSTGWLTCIGDLALSGGLRVYAGAAGVSSIPGIRSNIRSWERQGVIRCDRVWLGGCY